MLDNAIVKLVLTISDAKTKDQSAASGWIANLANVTEKNLSFESQEDLSAAIVFYTIYATSSDAVYLEETDRALIGHAKTTVAITGN